MASAISRVRKLPQWKVEEVNYLSKLFKEYPVFLIASIEGVPAKHLQNLRKKFSGQIVFRVSKNKLIMKAMEKAGLNAKLFEKVLTGQNILMFTNMNVFEAARLIEQFSTRDYYKPGEIADKEIVIPEGDTGIPPGPMLSVFGKLKIPTRVQANTIVVARDTVVAKPGDRILPELASLLQKLNMPLKEIKLKIKIGYDRGVLIPGDQLKLDIDSYVQELIKAAREAFTLGLEIVWPEPEIVKITIARAYREARALAIEAGYIAPETISDLIRVAHSRALALAVELARHGVNLGIEVKVQEARKPEISEEKREEKPPEEEEKKEGISEEELAAGLESLFGL